MKGILIAIIAAWHRWNIRNLRPQQFEYLRAGLTDDPHLRGIEFSIAESDRALRDLRRLA